MAALPPVELPGAVPASPMPNPYCMPPSALMESVRSMACIPDGFVGRVGALIETDERQLRVYFALEEQTQGLAGDYRELTQDTLWPVLRAADVPATELINGLGQSCMTPSFLKQQLDAYPDKNFWQGGREIAWRKGQLCYGTAVALRSPVIVLLNQHNRFRLQHRVVEVAEWWHGQSPAHTVRWDGTFYAPLAVTRPLFDWLSQGLGCVSQGPRVQADTAPDIPVIACDADLLVINKPARLACVPGLRETVSCQSLLQRRFGMLYVVHRLDMGTSGLLVFARHQQAQRELNASFRSQSVHKCYEALLEGGCVHEQGTICLPLAVDRLDRPHQCVLSAEQQGHESQTDYRVIARGCDDRGQPWTRVALYPKTGRTHQLRVHCAHALGLNAPIQGDPFYSHGGLQAEAQSVRLCLHATDLTFVHPATGQPLQFHCPAPWA